MAKYTVMIARFPFGHRDEPDVTDWLVETVVKMKQDPRIDKILKWRKDDTPITMSRNLCLEAAKAAKADYVLMVDNDMKPDAYLESNVNALGVDPQAKPFWDEAWRIAMDYGRPCMIGAPYCGPPPIENVYVFRWATCESDHPDRDHHLEQYSREEAAQRGGVELVAALPTGLCLLDMRALKVLTPPYFYYEWKDKTESKKVSTEDVTFSRDLSLNGVALFTTWDSWAGHWKWKCVGKPKIIHADQVADSLFAAKIAGKKSTERLVMVGDGEGEQVLPRAEFLHPVDYLGDSYGRSPVDSGNGADRNGNVGQDAPSDRCGV